MRILATLIFAWLWSFYAHAQLPSGSIAPDFTVTDINGNTHHLYEYLGQGYTVVLQFDATWVGPSWIYANSGALADLYYNHGVEFGGNVIVLFIEADGSTTTDNIYGIGNYTQGDWTSVVPFPIINLPSLGGYETQVGNDYNIAYYFPTIYTICPNGLITETGQIPYDQHWLFIQNSDCQAVYDVDAYIHGYAGESSTCDPVDLTVTLSNLGLNPLVSGQFQVSGVSPILNYTWNGYLNQFESTQINLGTAEVVGPVEINFTNSEEQHLSNNTYTPGILSPQFETSNVLQVELTTDCWPDETWWNITDSQGAIIYASPTYGDGSFYLQDPEYDLVNVVLPSLGCYYFTIYDAYNNGMSGTINNCGFDGYFSLNALDQNLNVSTTLYSGGGDQQFNQLIIPFTVNQISGYQNNVTLSVDMSQQLVSPNGVHVAGSFQNWNPEDPNYEMFDLDADGIYTIELMLQPGQYEYKFVNGNSWLEVNENLPAPCNYNGNRLLNVGTEILNETYCFNKCSSSCGSQCDPSSIDWSNETSIWLPNLSAGENLNEGLVNSPYSDNIYINTPTDLGVIVPIYAGLPLESLELTSIQVLLNGQLYPLEVFGLSFQGNNGIETPSLNAIPGLPACIEISGIPNQPGVYPLVITFYFTTSFFGSEIGQFYELNSYEIVVNENPFGCTNQLACNYNVSATIDDGSCLFVGATCDDANADTYGDMVNSNCECIGGSFSYGILPSSTDYTLCAENTSGLVLEFETLPMGISEYALQWYCRDGIQTAPSGSSTVGWTLIPDATSSVYVTPALSSNKTFACFVTPFAGVGLPAQWAAGAIRIEVLNLSAQSIIGNPNITPFTNYVYVVNPNAGNTYNWSVTNGGIISGQGTNAVTVMWGQNGPYQISLTESNGICSDESTLFVVNNSCSISVAAVSANGSSFCPGTTSSIEAITTATGVTYQWYLNGAELTGETNIDLEITSGGNYQVMITQGICTAISQTLAITELPAVVIPNLTMIQSNPGCSGGSATITAEGGSFTSYLWSNGANTSSIDVTVSGDYTVTLSDDNGCVATAGPISVNFALQDAVPICLVTVDPTTGSNVIVWEPVTSEVTNAYVIYKETNVADVYAAIGTVDYGSDGIFEDINSNSAVQASRYKLALIDTCDIESSPSSVHKTIHLTSNLGVGNTVNLIWSHYEGFAFGSYNIYRGTTSDDMILLATIASNLNSFTDLLPLDNGYYMIEVEGVSCDPSRTIQTSTSNVINYEFVGVEDLTASLISIYPNPATDRVTISSDAAVQGIAYTVHDATGRLVLQGKMSSSTTDIDVSMLQAGLYVWRVGNDVLHWVKN